MAGGLRGSTPARTPDVTRYPQAGRGLSLDTNGALPASVLAKTPGHEFAYNEFTSSVSITATTEATANTVVTASAATFDGTAVIIEFFSSEVIRGTGQIVLYLYQDGSSLGQIGYSNSATALPMTLHRRLSPSAGTHTYSVRAAVDAGTGTVVAGPGGSGQVVPGYIRITKA